MQLKYFINGIGIYIEYSNRKWNKLLEKKLKRQLDGFQKKINKDRIKQKLIFKNFSLLDERYFKGGSIVPENSIYKDGLFVELNLRLAFKMNGNDLIFWVHERSQLSIPFILHFLFKLRNIVFVHGAGISINNKGILLPAFGGIGKTSFISEIVKNESVKILGDDLILLDNKGYLHPYPRPFCLYSYHRKLFPKFFRKNKVIYKKPNLWNLGIIKIRSILNLPNYDVCYYKLAPLYKLFNKDKIMNKKVQLDEVYILKRYYGIKKIIVDKIDNIDEVVNFCVGVIFYEWHSFAKIVFSLIAQKEVSASSYYKFFRNIIGGCLNKAKNMYSMKIPYNISADNVAKEVSRIVLELNKRNL